MKNKTTIFIAIFLMVLSHSFIYGQASAYDPNELIIKWAAGITPQQQANIINQMGATVVDEIPNKEVLLFIPSFPVMVNAIVYYSIIDIIELDGNSAEVDDTGLNYLTTATPVPFSQYLDYMDMQNFSPIPQDCEAIYPGGNLYGGYGAGVVKVCIIDSGIDDYHPEINDYISCVVNILEDYDPSFPPCLNIANYSYDNDDNSHGTSVAGIIAGLCQRAGLSSENLQISVIKAIDEEGQMTLFTAIKAIEAASSINPNIVNISWSYTPIEEDHESDLLRTRIMELSNYQNVIIVAGAGNDGENLDEFKAYPGGFYGIDNMITVGGVNCDGSPWVHSNYGRKVDISAPSVDIIRPLLDGYWGVNSQGTSFSTPIVCAALVQVWATYLQGASSNPSAEQVRLIQDIILNTATTLPSLYGFNETSGVVNFTAAYEEAEAQHSNSIGGGGIGRRSLNTNGSIAITKEKISNLAASVSVSPNPFTDRLLLTFDNSKKKDIEIWTILGKKVWSQSLKEGNNGSTVINLHNAPPKGLYLLKIKESGLTSSTIIVKE